MTQRQLFLQHIAQTSPAPIALEIVKAEGSKLWDINGREYIDLIAGISVSNTGHRHPKVIEAIKCQLDAYLHLLVYGELVETPQVAYAKFLADHLPYSLNSVYFTNSGTEATEGAMKLAKRFTGRTEIIAFKNSYHGSTQGSLSVMGDEYWRNAFRPLLPDIVHLDYNSIDDLQHISQRTACVIAEPIQAERGVIIPSKKWITELRRICSDNKVLLVLDEIQTGFGRTGTQWAFEQFDIVPDILLLGKALGGGMPLGAFVSDIKIMQCLTSNPVLGHITTFGGHPVCCAAGLASAKALLDENIIPQVKQKEKLFLNLLQHPGIKKINSQGLLMSLEFENFEQNKSIIDACILDGVLTDWFLFAPNCMRIAPPLTISEDEIRLSCSKILKAIATKC